MKKLILIIILSIFLCGYAQNTMRCDYCDSIFSDYSRWYHLSMSGIFISGEQTSWDFCSLEHLKQWVEKQIEHTNDTRDLK